MALSEYKHHSSGGQRKDRAGEEGHEDKTDTATEAHSSPERPRQFPATLPGGVTGTSPAAQRGAARRHRAHGRGSGLPCATDGQPAGGFALALRDAAGHRSAQDLVFIPLSSYSSPRAAEGGTVGGSADCVSCFFEEEIAEQTVDIPVGSRGGSGHGRLPGFLSGQSSSPSAEQTVDIPVGARGGSRPSAVQNVDIQFPAGRPENGRLQGFHQGQVSTARRGAVSSTARRGAHVRGGGLQSPALDSVQQLVVELMTLRRW